MSSQISCPRCNQMDQVRKVTSIVTEGVSETRVQGANPVSWGGKTYYLPVHRAGSSVTMLAKRLLPPEKPKTLGGRFWGALRWGILLAFLGCCGCLGALPLMSMGDSTTGTLGVIAGLFFIALGAILSILAIISLASGKTRQQSDAEQRQYQRALAKWNTLYYCYRDDIVFVPGESSFASPEQLHAFLYQ